MEDAIRVNMLYDVYGVLLTEKQRTVMESYYWEDLSLTEIAEISQTSKQAISEQIRRSVHKLEEWEQVLHFAEHQQERELVLEEVISILEEKSDTDLVWCCEALRALLKNRGKEDEYVC